MRIYDLEEYNKKYVVFEDFEFDEYERVELLLFLTNYLNLEGKIDDYYLILGGRGLLPRHSFNKGDYLIQNARILLKTINQKKVYIDELNRYELDEENVNKLFIRQNDRFLIREDISKEALKKIELYLKLLSLEIKYESSEAKYAFKDEKRYGIVVEDKPISIKLFKLVKPIELTKIKKKKGGKLKILIKDLIEEADVIDNLLSSNGKGFRKKIIENSSFKKAVNGKLNETDEIEISNITNIVGQVGAGKSTFTEAAIKQLVKDKRKILIIEPSVNKVLRKCEDLSKLRIKAVPVTGDSAVKEHINKQNDGKDFLNSYDSKILTSGCAIGGLIKELDVTIEFGNEPCTEMYKFYELGEAKKNQLNKNKRFKCPYYYMCPKTRKEAEILTSEVIVTTTAGLTTMSIGISGMSLFQYVLEYVDLVIVDEAENELQKADKIYAPYISYDDYIRSNANISAEHYRMLSDERIASSESDKKDFIRLHAESNAAFTKIHNLLEKNKQGFNKSQLKNAITGKTLINYCKDNDKLPSKIIYDLNEMVGLKRDRKYRSIVRDLVDVKNERDLLDSFDSYDWGVNEKLTKEQVNMIIFIGAVLYFEDLYRSISNLVEGNQYLPMSTKAILSQRFEFHQKYVPVSPKGNIFAIQYRDKDSNGKSDLCVIKQFAMGRAMYLRFPWMKLNEKGEPIGPNVMLLSGSSFAPGSLSNHISEQINYIIQAEDYKREFISNSHFEYFDADIYVSGSGDERNKRLRQLVAELKETVIEKLQKTSDNILMIVNSYEDAEAVYYASIDALKDTDFKEKITYLVSDKDNNESNSKIKQSKVSTFAATGARILIAPAILIERGHNIVDKKGNAAFDYLIFVTRPMARPDDYIGHVSKVNGYIMSKYSNKDYGIDTEVFSAMRKNANVLYNELEYKKYSVDDLSPLLRKDIVVTLFCTILQTFGRLCRIGNQEDMKSKAPEVLFADAAFKSKNNNGFDFLKELVQYLDEIMNTNTIDGEVAKSLYEPFYSALKKGRHIHG
jgi:hypothetical protein